MKKLIFVILCLFVIKVVNAETLSITGMPYMVNVDGRNIRVGLIVDKTTKEKLFNLNIFKYGLKEKFNKESIVLDEKNNILNTIIHYGYNQDKNDLNYFVTQYLIWELVSEYDLKVVDDLGNDLNIYDDKINDLRDKVLKHGELIDVENPINLEVWEKKFYKTEFDFFSKTDDLVIEKENEGFYITGENIGKYELDIVKNNNEKNYIYDDGENKYYSSVGGPQSIKSKLNINITGVKLNIIENLKSSNNRFGDAKTNGKYELYLNDELKLNISSKEDYYIPKNKEYVLKDISENNGFNNLENIKFNVTEDDYNLVVNKEVIEKRIEIKIEDNLEYKIYLKSNNELYEVINKDTKEIILPYGLYYIENDNNYYKEFLVKDNTFEKLYFEKIKLEEEKIQKDIIEESNFTNDIDNPKTIDNIYVYILLFLVSSSLFFFLWKFIF